MINITRVFAGDSVEPEALNKKALDIVQRVRDKLTGKDFNTEVGPLIVILDGFIIYIISRRA